MILEPPKPSNPRGRPPTGRALPAAERMRRLRARRKAAGLKAVVSWQEATEIVAPYSSHRLAEARSLVMHTVIAEKIQANSALITHAQQNLGRWRRHREGSAPAWMDEWRAILKRPPAEVAAIICEPSERGARLRQSSPFAGALSDQERKRIYDAFRA
jgi:hypothetical protein